MNPRSGRAPKPAPMVADFVAQIAAGQVYVATDDPGALLGFIVFYPEDGHIMLENVAVLPRAAGRGVGKALIGFCEEAARQGGMNVRLYTNEKMTENLSIYPRLGMSRWGAAPRTGSTASISKRPSPDRGRFDVGSPRPSR